MTVAGDRTQQNRASDVSMILSEVACVDAIQSLVEFANKYVIKTTKLELRIIEG